MCGRTQTRMCQIERSIVLGLGNFEVRNWRDCHHHATLAIAAYGFRVQERCLFSLSSNSLPQTGDIRFPLPSSAQVFTPAALSVRTERHNPHAIATLRCLIATHLARSLPRCPCCLRATL
jgi:hypothetical protein